MRSRALAAVDLVRPPPKRRRQDGLLLLKSRAKYRSAALVWRRVNLAFLVASFCLLLAGNGAFTALPMLFFGLAAWLFERLADAPAQRRRSRIVADRRPLLMNTTLLVPPPRRKARILSLPAAPVVLALPPNRPRSRLVARRETANNDAEE